MTLKCTDYRDYCEQYGSVYSAEQSYFKPGLIYGPMDEIPDFFWKIGRFPFAHKYVVVSGMSDFGLELQEDATVANDMLKWLNFITSKIPDLGYEPLVIPPRCNQSDCKLRDQYSVKMYSFTKATFDIIPRNVAHWFCVNCNIPDNGRITKIPFGVAEWSAPIITGFQPVAAKLPKVYVNFQANTVQRFQLIKAASQMECCTVESEVSHADFVRRVSEHQWVICPEGNGFDSFRVIEVLSQGSVPIMVRNRWNRCYDGLRIHWLNSWSEFDYNKLSVPEEDESYKTDFEYWRNLIQGEVASL